MLTITQSRIRKNLNDASIQIPPETSEADRERLAAIAKFCFGHYARATDSWLFTETRGRKCWLLFTAGFSVDASQVKKAANLMCLRHPIRRARFNMSTAVTAALLMAEARVPVGEV